VIPIISMPVGRICDVELLRIGDTSPNAEVKRLCEGYAKYALMLFYPFTSLSELKDHGSYWRKFVSVGSTVKYDPMKKGDAGKEKLGIWEIHLQNIQTRLTAEKKMKRPPNPLVITTKTPETLQQAKGINAI
jgi:hypothetical protein